jgi:hypothetical protein
MGVFNDPVRPPAIRAGYGTAKKARNTLTRLRNRRHVSYKKAQQVARTMYYRAKFHKYQTQGMKEAMKVYGKYLGITNR